MHQETDLTTMVQGFRLYCLAEGKQPTTIRWYLGKLAVFQQYLQDNGLSTMAEEITLAHLRAFLVHLREDVRADEHNPMKPTRDVRLSANTIQGYARTLKAFFSWMAREDYITRNPSQFLRIPKAPRVIIATLNSKQIDSLIRSIDLRGTNGFRDYCLVLVLLDTGMRLSELVGMQLVDLDLERGLVKVMGKGARERVVPFGAQVQKTLWKYLQRHRPQPVHPGLGNVFLQHDGREMTPDQVYRLIRGYGERAGLEGVRCSPHTFRHTFAKNYLMNGGDVFSLQKILGHSSLGVVRLYVELTPEDVQARHRSFSPVDAMRSWAGRR